MNYKVGTLEDIPHIYALGKQMHEESEFSEMHWNPGKVEKWLHYNVTQDNRFVMCAYDEGRLAGVLIGSLSNFYFGDSTLASDLLWYVGKDYRGTRTGIKLLKLFRAWAEEKQADRIQVGISSGLSMDRTGALLKRMGFNQIGGLYKVDT